MNIRSRLTATLFSGGVLLSWMAAARSEPLTATAAIQTKPDPSAPVITYLKAGSEPAAAQADVSLPPGWIAVDVAGPFVGYVLNSDFTKGLDMRPGSPIFLDPKPGAGVLATAQAGDKADIVGLYGRWTQIRLDRHLTGYIQLNPAAAAPSAPSSTAAPEAAPAPVPALSGAPAATSSGEAGAVPRFFEGTVGSSRRLLAPRRPFDWELEDPSGQRIAYLDLTQLLLTEQIDKYVGRDVVVYGPVHELSGGHDIVIDVQSLQLK